MIRYFGTARIAKLVCYDPCERMLARCRERISDAIPCAEFVNEAPKGGSYNLLLTNSVLHHLPDPVKEFRRLAALMERAAVWISGHEPSKRYFTNPDCRRLF